MIVIDCKRNINFAFKIFATIILLLAATPYTKVVYEYGVYFLVAIGSFLFCLNAWQRKFIFRKIDITVGLFIIGFIITIITNNLDGIFTQGFVLLCALMYFFCFFSNDLQTDKEISNENRIIMIFITAFTFICLICSYALLVFDIMNDVNHSYNLHGGTAFQFIGIYSGLSTQAMMSGISAIISIYFIYVEIKHRTNRKIFLIFNIVNFILQDFALTISYTSASIIAFGAALWVGLCLMYNNAATNKNGAKVIIVIVISMIITVAHYCIMDYTSDIIIDNAFKNHAMQDLNSGNQNQTITADNGAKDMFTSNGRSGIWAEAVRLWKEKPIFGNEYGTFYVKFPIEKGFIEYRNIHSGYLEVLYSCGLWGFISIMIFGVYYSIQFMRIAIKERQIEFIGAAMLIVHACLYAAINQLFILDRSLNMFLICIFLGLARKALQNKEKNDFKVLEK